MQGDSGRRQSLWQVNKTSAGGAQRPWGQGAGLGRLRVQAGRVIKQKPISP